MTTVRCRKGNPVKQYEPFFSDRSDYEDEPELVVFGVTPLLHYDPLGRLVRTDFPNGTYARVETMPWRAESWDPSDTVMDSAWRAERIDYDGGDPALIAERRAAELTSAHASTPSVTHRDVLARDVVLVEHLRDENEDDVFLTTRTVLDVSGNALEVIDARSNTAEARTFDMLGRTLTSTSVDAGNRWLLADIAGAPLRSWNSRGFTSRFVYDALRRPTHAYVTPEGQSERLVTRTLFGESVPSPEATNLRTHVFRVYDSAGVTTSTAYDFKGNLVQGTRRLTLAYQSTPDWLTLDTANPQTPSNLATLAEPLLEAETFTITTAYDAFGRVTSRTTPDASETLPTYNEAGLLEAIDVRVRDAETATTFVSDFDYNARGQRLRCVHGNGTVTTYEYDPLTFRLTRIRLIRDSDDAVLQDLRYTYDPTGNITQIRDLAQQTVYFDNSVVTPDQLFEYDALGRLTFASGREHASLAQPTHADFAFGPQPHPDDPAALRTYEERYTWDAVGNILALQHTAQGGNFTRQYVYANNGNRLLANSAPGGTTPPFSHSYSYDAHGNMTAMPHLAALAWDHADRLQHADLGGGGDVWFVYDGAGNRVRKVQINQAGTTVRERIYLGDWEVWREHSGNPLELEQERQTLHVSDDNGRLCLVETLTVEEGDPVETPVPLQRHQHGNHLGSAALELDEDAAIISYEEFHPLGTTSYAANDSGIEVSPKRYRYIGQERDEETGLDHMGARYYAPWLGRWTAADPIGLGDGVNRFAYARGNPVVLVDPGGTEADDSVKVVYHRDLRASLETEQAQLEDARATLAHAREENRNEYKKVANSRETDPEHMRMLRDISISITESERELERREAKLKGDLKRLAEYEAVEARFRTTARAVNIAGATAAILAVAAVAAPMLVAYAQQVFIAAPGATIAAHQVLGELSQGDGGSLPGARVTQRVMGEAADALADARIVVNAVDEAPEVIRSTTTAAAIEHVLGVVPRSVSAAESAFSVASRGGRHAGFLKQAGSWTADQLRRASNSFQKAIELHEGYIANPLSHVPNWSSLSVRQQQGLIHHWEKEISNFADQQDIVEEIIRQGGQ